MCTEFSNRACLLMGRTNRVGFRKHISTVCVYCSLQCDVSGL